MSDYIPEDALTKILTYLPAKSLVRFTCVCKSWYSLITSSDFITNHLNQTKATNNCNDKHLILLKYYPGRPEKEGHALHIDNDTFERYDDIEFPFQSSGLNDYFHVLGSCNGLICLSDDFASKNVTFFLWNLSIRKCLALPLPEFVFKTHGPFDDAIGFGYDQQTNDYKVVRIVYLHSEMGGIGEMGQSPRVQIYKLSTRSWVTITTTLDPSYFIFYQLCTPVFMNGAVHWPAHKRNNGALIITFDMSSEVFREIRLPASYIDQHTDHFDFSFKMGRIPLAVCGEWLSFFDYQEGDYNMQCSIWVMKEYGVVDSWTKLYTIDLNEGLGKALGFRRNGEILLALKNRELVSCDLEKQQVKYLGIRDCHKDLRQNDVNSHSFHVDAYVESLVLVGDSNKFRTARDCDAQEEEKEKQIPAYLIGLG